jgi:dTMP kinase
MFVSFEGLDGSGKSTQVERLRAALHGDEMTPWAEALLYAAARAELVAEVIEPALARGADVLVDRYLDSSVVYQGIARGLGLEEVLDLNLAAVGGVLPDRTFVLALDAAIAGERVGEHPDRIERAGASFHSNVAAGYEQLATLFPERIVVLDATLPADTLAGLIQDELRRPA